MQRPLPAGAFSVLRSTPLLAALLVSALALGLWPNPAEAARKGRLSPAKVKQIRNTNKGFRECRQEVLTGLKSGKITKKRFEVELNNCRERYPGASLYIDCKAKALAEAKQKNLNPDKGISACKRFLVAASFDPTEPVPFYVHQGDLYFSGVGLNKTVPVASLDPPNFECDPLSVVSKNPAEAQYLLFGNHPRTFEGLENLKGKGLLSVLRFTKPRKGGVDVAGFGRVFGHPGDTSGVVFFPSAPCNFAGQLGDIFSGQSAYYLIDAENSLVTPYFGIAYYKPDSGVKTRDLIRQMIQTLGTNFKTFSKNNMVTFIAAGSVSETDDEEDPKNLCRKPRQHRFVAVVQARRDDPSKAEYLILANVKNLCDYGDRLARRLAK